jgi:hypothetical protein
LLTPFNGHFIINAFEIKAYFNRVLKPVLEKRIALLEERGVDRWSTETTIAEIVDVVGDLTIREYDGMMMHWSSRLYVDSVPLIAEATKAAREEDRQRTLRRQEEIRQAMLQEEAKGAAKP